MLTQFRTTFGHTFLWHWYWESLKRHWKWTSKWFSMVYIMSNCGKYEALINKKVSWSNYVNSNQYFQSSKVIDLKRILIQTDMFSMRKSNLNMIMISEFKSIPFTISNQSYLQRHTVKLDKPLSIVIVVLKNLLRL